MEDSESLSEDAPHHSAGLAEDDRCQAGAFDGMLQPVMRSLVAIQCVLALLVVLAGISLLLFCYQAVAVDNNLQSETFGHYVRNRPQGWLELGGHFLRFVIMTALAWRLWSYFQSARRMLRSAKAGGSVDPTLLFRALGRWWNTVGICGGLVVAFGVWALWGPALGLPHGPGDDFYGTPYSGGGYGMPDDSASETTTEAIIEFVLAENMQADGLTAAFVADTDEMSQDHRQSRWLEEGP